MKKLFTLFMLILTVSIALSSQPPSFDDSNQWEAVEMETDYTLDVGMTMREAVIKINQRFDIINQILNDKVYIDTSQIIYLVSNLKVEDILQTEEGVFTEDKMFLDKYWLSVAQVLPGYIIEVKEPWSIYSNEYNVTELIFLDENKKPVDNRYIIWDWRFASDYQKE